MAGIYRRGTTYYAMYYIGAKKHRKSLETDDLKRPLCLGLSQVRRPFFSVTSCINGSNQHESRKRDDNVAHDTTF